MKIVTSDAGKCNTKAFAFNSDIKNENNPDGTISSYRIRTRCSDNGNFLSERFSPATMIVQIGDGPVMKVGKDATKDPSYITSKLDKLHRDCVLTSFACLLGPGEHRDVIGCVTIPYESAKSVEECIEYKKFMLGEPGEEFRIKIKCSASSPVEECVFSLKKTLVYPEGEGILYEYPLRFDEESGVQACVDIGNQDITFLLVNNGYVGEEKSFTCEMGYRSLQSGLISALKNGRGLRVDEDIIDNVVSVPKFNRMISSTNKDVRLKSKEIIDGYIREYVEKIKEKMDSKNWPSPDLMQYTFFGGVPNVMKQELIDMFGNPDPSELALPPSQRKLLIPENSDMMNARGSLHMAASRFVEDGTAAAVGRALPFPEALEQMGK